MKKLIFFILLLFPLILSSSSYALEKEEVKKIWTLIYERKFPIAQEQVLQLSSQGHEDVLLSSLLSAYIYHRLGDQKNQENIFKYLDDYFLEQFITQL